MSIRRWRFAKPADPKAYKKARAGELRNFAGNNSVFYEAPESAEIHLNGERFVTNLVQQLLDLLLK
ncbi:adenylyl-sulfate kinase [Escherichia coli]